MSIENQSTERPPLTFKDLVDWAKREEQVTIASFEAACKLHQAADFIREAARQEQNWGMMKQLFGIAGEVIERRIPSLFTERDLTNVSITLSYHGSSEAVPLVIDALSDPTKTIVERGNFCIIPTKVEGLWIIRTTIDGQESYRLAGEKVLP